MTCWECQADVGGADFCPRCGKIQPDDTGERDYFRALGFSRPALSIDSKEIERAFHDRSRLFHPDRFQRSSPRELSISLDRSALLNEAYRVLRDRKARAAYLVEREGGLAPASSEVPTDLAELFFELRELLSDPGSSGRIREMKSEIDSRRADLSDRLDALCAAWDSGGERPEVLGKIRSVLHQEKYLASMIADLERRSEEGKERK